MNEKLSHVLKLMQQKPSYESPPCAKTPRIEEDQVNNRSLLGDSPAQNNNIGSFMFRLPKLPKSNTNSDQSQVYKGMPCFNWKKFNAPVLIGSGSYGKVFRGTYKAETVVVKEMKDAREEDLIKEARLYFRLIHENLVRFKGICPNRKSLMLDYICFDLGQFGGNEVISSLDDLLEHLDSACFSGFEHLVPCIGRHIVAGLSYLHDKGVAHRDLKPGNILISNQHLTGLPPDEQKRVWENNPCIAKLTDFGESWGRLSQSSLAACSHTVNVYKGTPAFLAPEVIDPLQRPYQMGEEQLKKADVWSLGMLLYCLVNPSCKVPYYLEGQEALKSGLWQNFIKNKIALAVVPMNDPKYEALRSTHWVVLHDIVLGCILKEPDIRMPLESIRNVLQAKDLSMNFPLKIHQGSAYLHAHEQHLLKQKEPLSPTTFKNPENDGRSGSSWLEVRSTAEEVIKTFPKRLNKARNINLSYSVREAYDVMLKERLTVPMKIKREGMDNKVFSVSGKKELITLLEKDEGIHIMTVPPYSFLVGSLNGKLFLIDTHAVSADLGGDGNAILKVFDTAKDAARWIWRRLYCNKSDSLSQGLVLISLGSTHNETGCQNATFSQQKYSGDNMRRDDNIANSVEESTTDSVTEMADEQHSPVDDKNRYFENNDLLTGCFEPIEMSDDDEDLVEVMEDFDRRKVGELDENRACKGELDVSKILDDDAENPKVKISRNEETSDLAFSESWEHFDVSYWGPYRLPYVEGIERRLSKAEMYALVQSKAIKATRVPQACRQNAIFLVESSKVKTPDDVKSDLNGVFQKCLEVKTHTVRVSCGENKKFSATSIARKKIDLQSSCVYMKVNQRENRFGLVRSITYFEDEKAMIMNNCIILQYSLNRKVCGDANQLEFKADSHGNSNEGGKPFHPVKKSMLENINRRLNDDKGKPSSIYKDLLKDQDMGMDFGDYPRGKKQVINIASANGASIKCAPPFEVEAILAYDHELEDNRIIWLHSDIPDDMWVLGTERISHNLKSAAEVYPVSIDPTFNHGPYEVTPITYRHPFIEAKSKNLRTKWTNAVLIGPTIIHHSKNEDAFDHGLRPIAIKTKLADAEFGILTDGESALIKACKRNFSKSINLRCTIHFKENCKEFLKSVGIKSETAQAPLLAVVFGSQGLIESEDKLELTERLVEAQAIIEDLETQLLPATQEKGKSFFTFLKERKKTVLRKLIRDVRRKAGMRLDDNGIPERAFTNQSETCNSVLAAKKHALGLSKKEDVPKSVFIKDVWQSVVNDQDAEIEKAIYGQSDSYRLIERAKYLEVPIEDWYNWSSTKRRRYLDEFHKLTMADVEGRKQIDLVDDNDVHESVTMLYNNLSVKLTDVLPSLMHVSLVEKKSLEILNSPESLVSHPTFDGDEKCKKYMVARREGGFYTVKSNAQLKVTCECKGFRLLKICSHSVAVAEKQETLRDLVRGVRISYRASITYPETQGGAGRKGGRKRKSRLYLNKEDSPSKRSTTQPFTEAWHNNEPLVLTYVEDVPDKKRRCGHCGFDFPSIILAVIPFNVVLSHTERWIYKNPDKSSDQKFLVSAPGSKTKRYYCIKKECILKHFPYFRGELLQIPDGMELKFGHKTLLREQLNVDV